MFAQAEKKTCYNRGHKHKYDASLSLGSLLETGTEPIVNPVLMLLNLYFRRILEL